MSHGESPGRHDGCAGNQCIISSGKEPEGLVSNALPAVQRVFSMRLLPPKCIKADVEPSMLFCPSVDQSGLFELASTVLQN